MDDDLYEGTEVFSALWTGFEEDSNVKQAPFTLTIIDNDSELLTMICLCVWRVMFALQ